MGQNAGRFKAAISDAILHVRKVKISPNTAMEPALTMLKGIPAKYPLRRGVVTYFVLAAGSFSFNKENLITGQLPRRAFLGLVSNTFFKGHGRANPFNFQHYNLNYLTLSSGNQHFPSKLITPNSGEGNGYVEPFNLLHQAANLHNSNTGLVINYDNYTRRYTLYGFDLTPDMCKVSHIDPIKIWHSEIACSFPTSSAQPRKRHLLRQIQQHATGWSWQKHTNQLRTIMNIGQLDHALRTNHLTSKLFQDVVAADPLPIPSDQRGMYVFKTDPHHLAGKQWVVIHFANNWVTYFDPMGAPIAKYLHDQLRTSGTFSKKTLHYALTSRIQRLRHTCGFYCAYYVLCLAEPELYTMDIVTCRYESQESVYCQHSKLYSTIHNQ